MACGEFAKPIYQLLDDLGGEDCIYANKTLLQDLIRWMSGEDIEAFVERFREQNDMPENDTLEESEEDSE